MREKKADLYIGIERQRLALGVGVVLVIFEREDIVCTVLIKCMPMNDLSICLYGRQRKEGERGEQLLLYFYFSRKKRKQAE